MSCPYCSKSNNGPFQMEYSNGDSRLLLKSTTGVTYETPGVSQSDCFASYRHSTVRAVTFVTLMSDEGKEVIISGDLDLVLNILEKLK